MFKWFNNPFREETNKTILCNISAQDISTGMMAYYLYKLKEDHTYHDDTLPYAFIHTGYEFRNEDGLSRFIIYSAIDSRYEKRYFADRCPAMVEKDVIDYYEKSIKEGLEITIESTIWDNGFEEYIVRRVNESKEKKPTKEEIHEVVEELKAAANEETKEGLEYTTPDGASNMIPCVVMKDVSMIAPIMVKRFLLNLEASVDPNMSVLKMEASKEIFRTVDYSLHYAPERAVPLKWTSYRFIDIYDEKDFLPELDRDHLTDDNSPETNVDYMLKQIKKQATADRSSLVIYCNQENEYLVNLLKKTDPENIRRKMADSTKEWLL